MPKKSITHTPFGDTTLMPRVVTDHAGVLLVSKGNIVRKGSCIDTILSAREKRRRLEKLQRRAAKKGGAHE
jgi:hypothetical protein